MAACLATVLHPERYHGHGKRPPFFEGWYYKLVDASEEHRLAFIPGVFLSADTDREHAFVQVLDGSTRRVMYQRYPLSEFQAAGDRLDVRIGSSRFEMDTVHLNLDGPEIGMEGTLHFTSLTPWPVTLTSPGVMGWYGWLPFMECYHGVLSLDHIIDGRLSLGSDTIDFAGGRGYMEKDWGPSFPSGYIWLQTNHFETCGTPITGSIAVIPWGRRWFRGVIIGLWHNARLYRLATYTGATVEHLEIADNRVHWVVRDRRYRLEMQAERTEGGPLKGPSRGAMAVTVTESLQSQVHVHLQDLLHGGESIFMGTGRHAGLEVVGELERLLSA